MMMDVRPLRTDADYEWALKEIEPYFENEPTPGTHEADRFDVLTDLINVFEHRHYPIPPSTPLETLNFYMEQNGLSQADLGTVIGSRSRASEVLAGKRSLSIAMIERIRSAWKISADLLIERTGKSAYEVEFA